MPAGVDAVQQADTAAGTAAKRSPEQPDPSAWTWPARGNAQIKEREYCKIVKMICVFRRNFAGE